MIKLIILAFQSIFQVSLMNGEEQSALGDAAQEIIIDAIGLCVVGIGIIVPITLRTLHKRLETAKNNEDLALLATYADIAVKAAEQSISAGKGTEKIAYASDFLANAAKKHGISSITPAMISSLLEAAVFSIKKESMRSSLETLKK